VTVDILDRHAAQTNWGGTKVFTCQEFIGIRLPGERHNLHLELGFMRCRVWNAWTCGMGVDIKEKSMAQQAPIQGFTRDQMEQLAQNRDNIVLEYQDTHKNSHAFTNTFIKEQVVKMRATFEDYLACYTKYTEEEVKNKVLNSKEAFENSWKMLLETQPKIFCHSLKKFAVPKDKEMYESLLKILELECLREKGLVKTEEQIENYWRSVGMYKEMCPLKYAMENAKKKKN